MHHTNVGITGAIRRNLQRTTISCKHSIAHGEKMCIFSINLLIF
ncbi:hypothetical protein T09_950 [Trichinella sp. T9]|nr:hypothetical protein T09_9572 [Trichinella sp. T9]KRX32292.1 hypothetical protein T09_950 [Trichinella sp. T9]